MIKLKHKTLKGDKCVEKDHIGSNNIKHIFENITARLLNLENEYI